MVESQSPRRFTARTRPRLVLGGLAAAAGISLSGCDVTPDFQPTQFTNVTECVNAGFSQDACDAGYNAAKLEYDRSAPQFSSREACEKEWGTGQCAAPQATGQANGSTMSNVFVPALAGFVLSQALQRRDYSGGYIGGGFGSYGGGAVYRDRGGSTVTLDRSSGKAVATPVNVNTRSVAKSGFGGMGMSRSRSFGG